MKKPIELLETRLAEIEEQKLNVVSTFGEDRLKIDQLITIYEAAIKCLNEDGLYKRASKTFDIQVRSETLAYKRGSQEVKPGVNI